MTPIRLLQTAIMPALNELATLGIPANIRAARFMLAIALQETGLNHRRQVLAGGAEEGPACSFWQFEKGGGCKGVLTHRSTAAHMAELCDAFNVKPEPQALWEAMRYQDLVAAAAARLLIYTVPKELPQNPDEGWQQYLAAWRPGKPHPETWARNWDIATTTVGVK
ncbi:hypothetical protein [Massilia endophytica]|uniref:hypothetical protein n=1 Tax=Massilia endophytica TaxID=2899220 RepID=UPI001E593D84|nr:hypothetical protein [Massilia endophytica]UGQ44983.1 hypothetical protein LSQ66_14370 [Massilia endophytica]